MCKFQKWYYKMVQCIGIAMLVLCCHEFHCEDHVSQRLSCGSKVFGGCVPVVRASCCSYAYFHENKLNSRSGCIRSLDLMLCYLNEGNLKLL